MQAFKQRKLTVGTELKHGPLSEQQNLSLQYEPGRDLSYSGMEEGASHPNNQSLSSSYRYYSKNIYNLIEGNTDITPGVSKGSFMTADNLLSSLAATDNVKITKITSLPGRSRSGNQTMSFSVHSTEGDDPDDPFQSKGFQLEILATGVLTFSFRPVAENNLEANQSTDAHSCAEVAADAFCGIDDKFLFITLKSPGKNSNIGNIRNLKAKYQIFSSSGTLLYEIPKSLNLERADQQLKILDSNGVKTGVIEVVYDGLHKTRTVLHFHGGIRPQDKLLLTGAVILLLGKASASGHRTTMGGSNKLSCSMGGLMEMILKKFCSVG